MSRKKVNNDKFIKYIKSYLDNNSMTQGDLAKEIGYTDVTLSRYLNYERDIPFDAIIKICNALNIDLLRFLTFYDDMFAYESEIRIFERISKLNPEHKREALSYIGYLLFQQYKDENNKRKDKKTRI